MKKTIICICLFIISFTNAQKTITTTGSDFSGDNFSISYTVGQLKVNTIDNVNSSPLILDFLQRIHLINQIFINLTSLGHSIVEN